MMYYLKNLLVFSLFMVCLPFYGQNDDLSLLTLDRIFSDEFAEKSFGPVKWLDNGRGYTVFESSAEGGRDIVQYDPETGDRKVLVPSQRMVIPGTSRSVSMYIFSENRNRLLTFTNPTQEVWGGNSGDYWVLDIGLWTWVKLGGDAPPQSLRGAKFSPDGKKVCYMKDHNLYVEDLTSFRIYQLTNTGSEKRYDGDWGSSSNYHWSPDSRYIAFMETDISDVPSYYMINNTESLYPKIIQFPYVKVGQKKASSRAGVVEFSGGEINWLNIPGISSDDNLRLSGWTGNSKELLLQVSNRTQDSVRVILAETSTGNLNTIITETDEAWLCNNSFTWIDEEKKFIWLSERDGWQHVYLYTRSGKEIGKLTPGEFDVISISGIDEKNGWLYYMASPDNPGQSYLYRTSLSPGGKQERITPNSLGGIHSYDFSPDMKWAIHNYSTIDDPPFYDLISLPDHLTIKVLESNEALKEKLSTLKKNPTEFFRVDIGEGVEMDGYCIKPPDMDLSKKYPLFYYIYGEPAGQTVLDRWSGTRYLWYLMLAQQGYVIMTLDNRGTPAPRGWAWRKAIDGQLGILAAHDQAAATRKIIETRPYIDPERIGVYGHSGGGQMSLNLIFRYPDLYHLAMPSSFVSNQRYYHPGYQEKYMGLLEDNEEGYINGSPITWAHQLEGDLLIIHGTGDSNVHYQSFEALINELVAHKKRFTMMSYPNRNHGLREGENTQYHLYDLRTNFLMTNMPPGAK
ncbi:MAG TPA: DPP IV N-terminal domain-containing protein [Bacteroidales bacterium]|nr:DPP IV N-terminal domain-containing protein [Bacteroidales bacterium]